MTDRKHLKKRYRLDDLVQQCDPTAEAPLELNGWDEAPEVGREVIQDASKDLRGTIRSPRAVSVDEMRAAVRTKASQNWDTWFGGSGVSEDFMANRSQPAGDLSEVVSRSRAILESGLSNVIALIGPVSDPANFLAAFSGNGWATQHFDCTTDADLGNLPGGPPTLIWCANASALPADHPLLFWLRTKLDTQKECLAAVFSLPSMDEYTRLFSNPAAPLYQSASPINIT